MDEDGAVMIPIHGGRRFNEMSVGKHMLGYDAMVVLTHFKGHAMGGYGGSMKNIAIGCADGLIGKKLVHAAPDNDDYKTWLMGKPFQENMVESAKAILDHFGEKIVYVNVLRNMRRGLRLRWRQGRTSKSSRLGHSGFNRLVGCGAGVHRHGVCVARGGASRPKRTHRDP